MLTQRKQNLRHMLNVMGEEISYNGVTIKALVRRQIEDRSFARVDITVHVDDIAGAPEDLTPVIIDGTQYTVLQDDALRPRGGADRWIIPLGAGKTATSGIKRGRYER